MRSRTATCSLVVLALLAGCSTSDGEAADPIDGSNFMVWTEPDPSELDAEMFGQVIIEDSCVFLSSLEEASNQSPVIWPFGATFDGLVITLADGREVADGAIIRSAGGGIEPTEYFVERTTLSLTQAATEQCGELPDRISMLNALADITID